VRPDQVPPGPLAIDTDAFSQIHMGKGRHKEFAALVAGWVLPLLVALVLPRRTDSPST
jgi:hypothetical protein